MKNFITFLLFSCFVGQSVAMSRAVKVAIGSVPIVFGTMYLIKTAIVANSAEKEELEKKIAVKNSEYREEKRIKKLYAERRAKEAELKKQRYDANLERCKSETSPRMNKICQCMASCVYERMACRCDY